MGTSKVTIKSTTIQSVRTTTASEQQKIQNNLKENQKQLKIDHEKLEKDKQIQKSIKSIDVIRLNVGGEIMMTTRKTLIDFPKSILSIMFNGNWEQKLPKDKNGNIFLDFNPILFRHLLDQLQILDKNNIINLYLPSQPSLIEPFKKMLKKLNLNQLSSFENNIITFNIGGQIITNQRKTFHQISNSTLKKIVSSSKITKFDNKSDVFLDYDPKLFQHLIKRLREKSFKSSCYVGNSTDEEKIFFKKLIPDFNICLPLRASLTDIPPSATWNKNGQTVAGQNPALSNSCGLYVDDNQTVYVADYYNHRIIAWKSGETNGQIVAGGHGEGNGAHQLNRPTDVIIDKEKDNLIICDNMNKRVVRWPRQNGKSGEIIISNIFCVGLTMDENGFLYVTNVVTDEVRRYGMGESKGIIVAGGNGPGNRLNQLKTPVYIFVDREHSVYVSDYYNHRVMKWTEGAKEGIVVAGGQGEGNSLTQLHHPQGVLVDQLGTVYVADEGNNRIIRWFKGAQQGNVIVGGNGKGTNANQLNVPMGMSFDRYGHLYVVDNSNKRVQRFTIEMPRN